MRPRHITEEELTAMIERRAKVVRVGTVTSAERAPTGRNESIQQAAPSPYKSKWESAYANQLDQAKLAGHVKAWWYEPFSIWLPGGVRYKPDFLVQYPDGLERRMHMVEVKGWSRNLRDGMTRLKIAAALFPCFSWTLAKRGKGGAWEEQTL